MLLSTRSTSTGTAVAIATLVCAAVLGISAGLFGWPVLGVLIAVAGGVTVLANPFLGLLLYVATVPINNVFFFAGGASPLKLLGAAVFFAWLLRKMARRESWQSVLSSGLFLASILFSGFILASMLWARYPSAARSGFISIALMIALTIMVIDLADSRTRLLAVVKVLVVSAALAVVVTLYQSLVVGLRRAGGDVAGDVNATATMLVTCLPLAFYLMRSGGTFGWRFLGMSFIPMAVLAVLVTYSRFNLLLVVPMLLVLYGLAVREGRSTRWLLTLTVATVVAGAFFVPWDKLLERAETIQPYIAQSLQSGEGDVTMSGRGYHLRIGLAIARDHPIIGVGYRNYGYYFIEEYQHQVPGADRLYTTPRSPHSSYVGIIADLGVIGLLLWVTILGLGMIGLVRAWRRFTLIGDSRFASLAESLAMALGVHVFAYGWYLPNQQSKILWVVLGMSVALDRLSVSRQGGRVTAIVLESPRSSGSLTAEISGREMPPATL